VAPKQRRPGGLLWPALPGTLFTGWQRVRLCFRRAVPRRCIDAVL